MIDLIPSLSPLIQYLNLVQKGYLRYVFNEHALELDSKDKELYGF